MTIETSPAQGELWCDEPSALGGIATEQLAGDSEQGDVDSGVATIDPSKWKWYEGVGDGEKKVIAWMIDIVLRAHDGHVLWRRSDGSVERELISRFVALSSSRFGISPVAVSLLTQELLKLGLIRDGDRERTVAGGVLRTVRSEAGSYMDGKLQGAGGHLED